MVSGAIDINTDPACSRAMDPDMVLSSSSHLYDTIALDTVLITQIVMAH